MACQTQCNLILVMGHRKDWTRLTAESEGILKEILRMIDVHNLYGKVRARFS